MKVKEVKTILQVAVNLSIYLWLDIEKEDSNDHDVVNFLKSGADLDDGAAVQLLMGGQFADDEEWNFGDLFENVDIETISATGIRQRLCFDTKRKSLNAILNNDDDIPAATLE